ncbi:MAG: metallophosphoesterase [Candidatus Aminicenantes bacterium]|nr:metallophosphoesterase [Candidatus Aminicenantes bacterium]
MEERNRSEFGSHKHVFLYIFLIFLLSAAVATAKDSECRWSGIERVVAIGDLHGDYNNFVRILKGVRLVDESVHWIGGKTHLVQTGDVMDRGPDAKIIFDLIMNLEKEAEQAGGMVHMLIGNHEEMNITGIAIRQPRYVLVSQFLSFLPSPYIELKEKEIRKRFESEDHRGKDSGASLETELEEFWTNMLRNSDEAKSAYTAHFNDTYGKWIIEHNAVIKINGTVFVHGGISHKYSQWKLEDINTLLRMELNKFRIALKQRKSLNFKPRIVYASDGPLWYRGLAQEDSSFTTEVDKILDNLQAERMVIAHTPQRGSRVVTKEFVSRFDGKVWVIDTGISKAYGGFLSALIIEGGELSLWGENNENN